MGLDYIRFDVGHYLHVCHKNTVQKYPNSSLAVYVKSEFDQRQTELDYIVIDRDGKHFGTVLNFMRDQRSLHLEKWTKDDLTDLMTEADFCCLTELVEICDKQIAELAEQEREMQESNEPIEYKIPRNNRFETVFGTAVMREVLRTSTKRVIIMSARVVRRFHLDPWLEELVKFCDFTKVSFYCFSDKNNEPILPDKSPAYTSSDFMLAIYDPRKQDYIGVILATTDEKFRTKRYRYKTKLLTFCFCAHSDNFHELMKS